MKPFDPKAKCPKCGHDELNTYHCEGGGENSFLGIDCDLKLKGQHLHRSCLRCKFEWAEACIKKSELSAMAKALGSRGGLKGGPARAASMTSAERSAVAKKASKARWQPSPADGQARKTI